MTSRQCHRKIFKGTDEYDYYACDVNSDADTKPLFHSFYRGGAHQSGAFVAYYQERHQGCAIEGWCITPKAPTCTGTHDANMGHATACLKAALCNTTDVRTIPVQSGGCPARSTHAGTPRATTTIATTLMPTLAPTASTVDSKKICIKVATGKSDNDDGYISVTVDQGKGAGYESVSTNNKYKEGSLVIQRCYGQIKGVQVQNPTDNRWAGSVTFSVDDGRTYAGGTCANCQSKPGGGTQRMYVEAENNSGSVRFPMLLLVRFAPILFI